MNFHTRCGFIGTAALVAALGQTGNTQMPQANWPQWRGAARDGVVAQSQLPASWPEQFTATWTVEVGEGYSSPVSADGRIFVHSRRDPQEVVTAIDAATGKHLWQKDFSSTVDSSKLFCGTAASPVLAHGLLVVQVGSDVHGGQIIGLDPATGTTKWTWKGAGLGYASPFVTTIADTSQLITMTNASVVGLDARTGQFVALDAPTGDLKWSSEGRTADHASVLLTSGYVVYLTSGGELMLVQRKADGYVRDRVYDVADRATYAMPAFLNGDLIVRDTTHLTRLSGR